MCLYRWDSIILCLGPLPLRIVVENHGQCQCHATMAMHALTVELRKNTRETNIIMSFHDSLKCSRSCNHWTATAPVRKGSTPGMHAPSYSVFLYSNTYHGAQGLLFLPIFQEQPPTMYFSTPALKRTLSILKSCSINQENLPSHI